jgi:FO synthase
MAKHPEPSIDEMMLTLSAARLILDPAISLQAPPNLEEHHLRYLQAGINDWGGISPLTQDFINPDRAWPQLNQLARQCQQAGFDLRERLTVYPAHIQVSPPDDSNSLISKLQALSTSDGLARHCSV